MAMDVIVPVPAKEFNYDSNCSSPYMTAPSSPQRIANMTAPSSPQRIANMTAPSSPQRIANFYFSAPASPTASWESKPETPTRRGNNIKDGNGDDYDGENQDFAFDFSGQLDRISLSAADELFDGGKIRPLKPGGGFDSAACSAVSSPRSPKGKNNHGSFDAALQETCKKEEFHKVQNQEQQQRGRERKSCSASYVHKGSRSLSPMRVSDIILETEDSNTAQSNSKASSSKPSTSSNFFAIFSSVSLSKGYKKWKLSDLLLFRSASEGRATGKDAIGKYAALSRKPSDDVKNSSFRSTDSFNSATGSKRRMPVSAHELHYTANRAAAEEMKKKTFLPYKQGLLGCLGFRPGMHEISRGIGSMTRGSS